MSTAVKEKPIIFSAPMVRAILAGTKTQTRRVVKPQPPVGEWIGLDNSEPPGWFKWRGPQDESAEPLCTVHCPYEVGMRLWVRETWRNDPVGEWGVCYKATGHDAGCKIPYHLWRPSIHMPRWASRITLEVTDVRVERLQEISEADAIAEGLIRLPASGRVVINPGAQYFGYTYRNAREAFAELWDSINASRPGCAWADSPWVWAVEFRRVQ